MASDKITRHGWPRPEREPWPSAADVFPRLKNLRRARRGWSARCPSHQDRQNSLSIAIGADERVLLHCFTGCRFEEIISALALERPRRPGDKPLAPAPRPLESPLAEARRAIIREGRGQRGARPGVRLRYAIADWLRAADDLRRLAVSRGES